MRLHSARVISSRSCLHLRLGLLLSLGLMLPGCARENSDVQQRYYQVQVTDPRGHFVADWVAKGRVRRTDRGYSFRAIERHTAPPFPQDIHYPEGRMVEATSANILVSRCGEPLWHYFQVPAE